MEKRTAKDLTPSERDVWMYILTYHDENGFAPTLTEIGEKFGHGHSWAHYNVQGLSKSGFVKVEPNKLRGIRVLS